MNRGVEPVPGWKWLQDECHEIVRCIVNDLPMPGHLINLVDGDTSQAHSDNRLKASQTKTAPRR